VLTYLFDLDRWGHDFRPEYRRIHELRDVLPDVAFMCLTATASERVHKDIITNMRLRTPVEAKGSFDRPNLTYTVMRKRGRKQDIQALFAEYKRRKQAALAAAAEKFPVTSSKEKKSPPTSAVVHNARDHGHTNGEASQGGVVANKDQSIAQMFAKQIQNSKAQASVENDDDDEDHDQNETETSNSTQETTKGDESEAEETETEDAEAPKKRVRNSTPFPLGVTVMYCNTKKEVEAIAQCITDCGVRAIAYHAGLPPDVRTRIHDDFVFDRIEVLVATTAFGMGIDKPDIRRIVHYGCPKSLETYVQQTGRAGRDGAPADCIMYWNDCDFMTNARLMEKSAADAAAAAMESGQDNETARKKRTETLQMNKRLLDKMKHFATVASVCRRAVLLEYFGQKPNSKRCGQGCDNCQRYSRAAKPSDSSSSSGSGAGSDAKQQVEDDEDGVPAERDCTDDVLLLLRTVETTRGRFGITMPIDVLMGSGRKQIKDKGCDKLDTYGKGRHHSTDWWKQLARVLIEHQYLCQQQREAFVSVCALDSAGEKLLQSHRQNKSLSATQSSSASASSGPMQPRVMLAIAEEKASTTASSRKRKTPSADAPQMASTNSTAAGLPSEFSPSEVGLYNALSALRSTVAKRQGVPAYVVFQNKQLHELVRKKPITSASLLSCEGVGVAKATKYGSEFSGLITKYCADNGIAPSASSHRENAPASAPTISGLSKFAYKRQRV